jgi:hypothetical protein
VPLRKKYSSSDTTKTLDLTFRRQLRISRALSPDHTTPRMRLMVVRVQTSLHRPPMSLFLWTRWSRDWPKPTSTYRPDVLTSQPRHLCLKREPNTEVKPAQLQRPPHSRWSTSGARSAWFTSDPLTTAATSSGRRETSTTTCLALLTAAVKSRALHASSTSHRSTLCCLTWKLRAGSARSATARTTLSGCGRSALAFLVRVATSLMGRSSTSCLRTKDGRLRSVVPVLRVQGFRRSRAYRTCRGRRTSGDVGS